MNSFYASGRVKEWADAAILSPPPGSGVLFYDVLASAYFNAGRFEDELAAG